MSLETWKEEFYKTTPLPRMTKRKAIGHCFLKWSGLKKKNLDKHDVILNNRYLADAGDLAYGDRFYFYGDTCALCIKYQSCHNCPICVETGKQCSDVGSEYDRFVNCGDSKPMRRLLKRLLEAA